MQAVWPGAFVTDDSLVQCTLELRRALGDGSQDMCHGRMINSNDIIRNIERINDHHFIGFWKLHRIVITMKHFDGCVADEDFQNLERLQRTPRLG